MKTNRIQTLFLALTLVLSVAPCACAQEAPLQGFDEYVNKALKDWEVPASASPSSEATKSFWRRATACANSATRRL